MTDEPRFDESHVTHPPFALEDGSVFKVEAVLAMGAVRMWPACESRADAERVMETVEKHFRDLHLPVTVRIVEITRRTLILRKVD